MPPLSRRLVLLPLAVAALLAAHARAQTTYTWTGSPNNGWGSSAPGLTNWLPNSVPPSSAVVAFVNPSPYQTVDLQASRTVNSVTFGGSAAYNLTNGILTLSTGNVTVTGPAGSAVEHVIGGAVVLGASGTWAVNTSNLRVPVSIIGNGFGLTKTGTGTLTLTGISTYTGDTTVNAGTLALSGSGQLTPANTYVGLSGTGAFTQTGGTYTVASGLYLGSNAGAAGTYDLQGGNLSAPTTHVGESGAGTFTQTGGTHTVRNSLALGYNAGGSGSYTLSAGTLSAITTNVGEAGTGTFTQTGGTHTVSDQLNLGDNTGSGTYLLSGGTLSAATTYVGYAGSGTFTQTGGLHLLSNGLFLAGGYGTSGSYTLQGGTLQTPIVAQTLGAGTFAFDGGTLRVAASSTFFFQGLSSATVRAGGGVIDTNGFAVTVGQPLSHDTAVLGTVPDGGLTKTGAGALTLTGANTYTGGTTILASTLRVASDSNLGRPAAR